MLARNRPRLTRQALDSLIATPDCNITVLDDRSEEETAQIIQGYTAIIYALSNDYPWGTGALRNTVIKASQAHFGRGDYLYLSDNDVFFKEGWLETLISAYGMAWQWGFRVIGAYNHPYHQPISSVSVRGEDGSGKEIFNGEIQEVNALALQSMLMRWEVWDKYGPFCATPVDKVCQSEDVDFTNKIHADGFKIGVVSPALIVSTGITNTFGEKIPGWELVKAQCPAGVIIE